MECERLLLSLSARALDMRWEVAENDGRSRHGLGPCRNWEQTGRLGRPLLQYPAKIVTAAHAHA